MMGYAPWPLLGFGLLHLLFWIALLALLVWGFNLLFRRRAQPVEESALEILQRRFARGEITEAEYTQAKKALS